MSTAPSGLEGEGFPVRRAFAGRTFAELDPFVHMDQMGEVDYAPGEPKGTPWHPHRGFETVTYMIDGTFAHQDSNGGGGLITDGATQWMTAGRGILHIETPPEELVISGGLFHGIQLWVNLPAKKKWIPPAYQPLEAADVALVASPDAGALVRVIAGDLAGVVGPGSTHTPISLMHASITPGSLLELPWNPAFNSLVYVLAGSGEAGPDRQPIRTGQLVTFGPGQWLSVRARTAPRLALGEPGSAPSRRRANRRARRTLRPVRDEHPRRDRPGRGGLRGRPTRSHTAQRPDAPRARSRSDTNRANRNLTTIGDHVRVFRAWRRDHRRSRSPNPWYFRPAHWLGERPDRRPPPGW